MKRLAIIVLSLVASSCAGAQGTTSAPTNAQATSDIAFIEDDYPRALAEAKKLNRPLFVDAWAPWCHTCLSVRAYVLSDPRLRPLADRYVFAAIDTEKPVNAEFLSRYPVDVWPTLWVFDPKTEKTVLKWLGSANPAELTMLLEDAAVAIHVKDSGGEAGSLFLTAKRAFSEGKTAEAIDLYRQALAKAPVSWLRRAQLIEALALALHAKQENAACVALAKDEFRTLGRGTSQANLALTGLQCTRALPSESPEGRDLLLHVEVVKRIALDMSYPILADDRSGLFEELVSTYKAANNNEAATRISQQWAQFLETEAARAPSKEARVVFDAHRLLAYLELHEPQKAIDMLSRSESDLPSDYNSPARLARVYFEMHRYDDALGAIERALSRVYGPRELRLQLQKADILEAKGDIKGATDSLEKALKRAQGMTLSAAYQRVRESLEKRLSMLNQK